MVVPLWHGKTRARNSGSKPGAGAALILMKMFLCEDSLGLLILLDFPRLHYLFLFLFFLIFFDSSRTEDLSQGQGDKDVRKIEQI